MNAPEGWTVDGNRLRKEWKFADFGDALAFVNRVGAIAEGKDHHPEITFGWGYARIVTWTHTTGGLTEKDYDLAAAIG